MIKVNHLTKRYGNHTAVSDLSFTIEKGKIYGFLGPNGAGKSTTMNIIAGCLGATEGEVFIAGHSIEDDPLKAKRHIGYLPELPPLYMDMTTEEYLKFVACAKGVARKKQKQHILDVMEKVRITDVKGRLIRNLSKGYRQRVGIAQALLGNPEVIILDEPTVGLDPKQIIEIRQLIRDLGKDHTVILSSHILSEVQAVCDSVLIISGGKLAAHDTTENLSRLLNNGGTLYVTAECTLEEAKALLADVEGVHFASEKETEEGAQFSLALSAGQDVRQQVFAAFARNNKTILEMRLEKASLEKVFLELTESENKEEGENA